MLDYVPNEVPEGTPAWISSVLAVLGTLGAGGLIKIYSTFQAGKRTYRQELGKRILHLEEVVATLQSTIADLKEENGLLRGRLEAKQDRKPEGE